MHMRCYTDTKKSRSPLFALFTEVHHTFECDGMNITTARKCGAMGIYNLLMADPVYTRGQHGLNTYRAEYLVDEKILLSCEYSDHRMELQTIIQNHANTILYYIPTCHTANNYHINFISPNQH